MNRTRSGLRTEDPQTQVQPGVGRTTRSSRSQVRPTDLTEVQDPHRKHRRKQGPDPPGPDPSGPDPPGLDPPGPDPPGPDPSGPDPSGPDPPGPDPSGPDPSGPDPPGLDPLGLDPLGPDPSGPDPPVNSEEQTVTMSSDLLQRGGAKGSRPGSRGGLGSTPGSRGGLGSSGSRGGLGSRPGSRGGLGSSGSRGSRGGLGSRGSRGSSGSCGSRGGLGSVAQLLKQGLCQKVVVVAGAGISTASGIPDFRTPGTGLYSRLESLKLPFPEAVFHIDFFSEDPRPFFSLARALYPGNHRPNYVHYFLLLLHLKGLLLRLYTQNIDGLETLCGIPEEKLVEAHGSFATASCHLCYTSYPAEQAKRAILSGSVPSCSFCSATVKPDVVFFGEDLPPKYFLHQQDFPQADLLIVMGTSLQIEPFASLVDTVRSRVPRLLLNREAVGPFAKTPLRRGDHLELGDLEVSVRRLVELLDWSDDITQLMRTHGPPDDATAASPPGLVLPEGPGGAETPRSRPGDQETDSETDSKSSSTQSH